MVVGGELHLQARLAKKNAKQTVNFFSCRKFPKLCFSVYK